MTANHDLDDILSTKELKHEEPKAKEPEAPKVETEPVKDSTKVESGDKPKAAESPSASVEQIEKTVPLKALEEERRKRQEYERRIKELETTPKAPEQEQPQFWENPEQYLSQLGTQIRIETSQATMRAIHQDYDEMESLFVEKAKAMPYLVAQLQSHPNPALFAYQTAKQLKEMDEIREAGGVEALRKRIAEETEAKVRKDYEAKLAPATPAIPTPSLAAAPAQPSSTADTWKPPSTDDIFAPRKRA